MSARCWTRGFGQGSGMLGFLKQECGGSLSSSDIFQMYKGEQATLAANEPHGLGGGSAEVPTSTSGEKKPTRKHSQDISYS
jgi:hypothetical protein